MGNCITCKHATFKRHDKQGIYPDYYCSLLKGIVDNPNAECESYEPR